jgi:hypothetical protein
MANSSSPMPVCCTDFKKSCISGERLHCDQSQTLTMFGGVLPEVGVHKLRPLAEAIHFVGPVPQEHAAVAVKHGSNTAIVRRDLHDLRGLREFRGISSSGH